MMGRQQEEKLEQSTSVNTRLTMALERQSVSLLGKQKHSPGVKSWCWCSQEFCLIQSPQHQARRPGDLEARRRARLPWGQAWPPSLTSGGLPPARGQEGAGQAGAGEVGTEGLPAGVTGSRRVPTPRPRPRQVATLETEGQEARATEGVGFREEGSPVADPRFTFTPAHQS